MPRVADHEQRRRQVAGAAMRVVAAAGMERVRVADVAAEAGVSVGLVQHYFRSKDDLLLFAFEHLCAQLTERAFATGGPAGTRQGLFDWVSGFLAIGPVHTQELKVYLAFCGRAPDSERMRVAQAEAYERMRLALVKEIELAQGNGLVPAWRDAKVEAIRLWALVDGLGLHGLADPERLPAATQLAVLDAHLAELFGGGEPR